MLAFIIDYVVSHGSYSGRALLGHVGSSVSLGY